jgi:hypothetical protein
LTAASTARRAWLGLEAVHAVVYFAPEARDAYAGIGIKSFWMGYFASRAAPMGAVDASVVEATFFGFAPDMVRRALPDAWAVARPADVLAARRTAAEAALHRLLGPVDVEEVAALTRDAVGHADVGGRPLFAAHRALPWPGSPLLDLWHGATLLREHRGDGHVAACVVEGIDGLEAHVLQAVIGGIPRETLQPNRGWTDAEWLDAEKRLRVRGVLDDRGRTKKAAIEARTDEAASRPYESIDADRLCALLEPLRAAILAGGGIPIPNPMGMPGDRAVRA